MRAEWTNIGLWFSTLMLLPLSLVYALSVVWGSRLQQEPFLATPFHSAEPAIVVEIVQPGGHSIAPRTRGVTNDGVVVVLVDVSFVTCVPETRKSCD